MTSVKVITGKDLIKNANYLGLDPLFSKRLDPNGFNVVYLEMLHNDGAEMRLMMLFKIINKEEPFEGRLTLPMYLFQKIVKTYQVEDTNEVH